MHAIESTQSVNTVECPTLPYKSRCARGSSSKAELCNKIDWLTFDILRNQAKTKDSCAKTMQSLSLSFYDLLSKFANSQVGSDVPDQGQTSIPRVVI